MAALKTSITCSFPNFNVFSFQYLVSRDNTMTRLLRMIYRKNALYDKQSMVEFCRQGRENRDIFDRMPVKSGDNCMSQKYFEWKGLKKKGGVGERW